MWLKSILPLGSSKTGTTFVSFAPALEALCRGLPFNNILEFGPGHSTAIFLRLTGASIISVESSLRWFAVDCLRYRSDRLRILHRRADWDPRQLGLRFSLVFVDGGDRVLILRKAFDLMRDDGMVFLHDAHREEYEAGIRLYPHGYFPERHSCILFKVRALRESVERLVPPDHSCCCRYCSSEGRRAYFRRLSGRFEDHS